MTAMAYDEERGQVVMYFGGTGLSNETWLWDGADWTKANPAAKPRMRLATRMVYDPVNEREQAVPRGHLGLGRRGLDKAGNREQPHRPCKPRHGL